MLKALLKELRSYRRGKCSCYRQSQVQPCKQRPGLVLPCVFRTHRHSVSAGTSTTTPITEAAPPPCWGRLQPDPAVLAQQTDGVHSPLGNTQPSLDSNRTPKSGTHVLVRTSPSPAPHHHLHQAVQAWRQHPGANLSNPPGRANPSPHSPHHSHFSKRHLFTGMSLALAPAEPESCPTPSSGPWTLLEAQRGSQPSREHAGVSSKHAACTQHTQAAGG